MRRRSAARTSRPFACQRSSSWWLRRSRASRRCRSSCRRRGIRRGRSSLGPPRPKAPPRTASSSCCTTSPTFGANVSHELRTPLTAIRGYVEALTDGDADAEDRQRFLEIIARHTHRMERLVRDLLRLARLDANQETLDPVACDVRGIADAVVADLTPEARQRRQRLTVDVAPDAESVRA